MAFVNCVSEEYTKSELDLFQIAPTQTSTEKSLYIEIWGHILYERTRGFLDKMASNVMANGATRGMGFGVM